MTNAKKKKIRSPLDVIKGYLRYDWLYFFTPFVCCVLYAMIFFDYTSLQYLVNGIYQNPVHLAVAAGLAFSLPNVVRLITCQHHVLRDMPRDVVLPAASSERFGGAGCGKTSSAMLQAIFEAREMEVKMTKLYYYIKSNYVRWAEENPVLIKDFSELEKSVHYWRQHPEYIPFLCSNVTIYDKNGRRSRYVDGDALAQKEWVPASFIVVDEAGNEIPQELFKDRPAGVTMFFRYIRHFGFRITLLEQKVDGIYINVRSVLGTTCLAMGQRNVLLPDLMIDIIDLLKRILSRWDADDHPELSDVKKGKMRIRFHRLGHFIETLQNFSNKLGFRVWEELLIKCPSAQDIVPPEKIMLYCTNEMPVWYDDREFSQLYLQATDNPVKGDFVSKDNKAGQHILARFAAEERSEQAKRLDEENKLEALKQKQEKLALSRVKLDKQKANSGLFGSTEPDPSDDTD